MWASESDFDPVSQSIWVLPAGWQGGSHTNPQKQLAIPLSGSWRTEIEDGVRTVMEPGDPATVLLMIPAGPETSACGRGSRS